MNTNIKMIALDLDGTLLTSKKEVSAHTAEVLEQAVDHGVAVVVSTGRPLTGLPNEVLNLKGIRYALTANGARIFDLKENKIIYEKLVSYDDAKKMMEIFGKYDALLEIYYDGQGYADEEKLTNISRYLEDFYMGRYIAATRKGVADVHALFGQQNQAVDKVQAIFKTEEEKRSVVQILREDPQLCRLEITGALSNNIEVNAEGVNKGKGLICLGELLDIDRTEIMACGDGNNDVEMMREVGLAVAMKNSCDEILEMADYVTDTNDNDGVAKAVEKFVLNR